MTSAGNAKPSKKKPGEAAADPARRPALAGKAAASQPPPAKGGAVKAASVKPAAKSKAPKTAKATKTVKAKAKAKSEAPTSPAAEPIELEGESPATADEPKAKSGGRRSTLLIVESPAKAKTIQKYLGRAYVVIASKGHVKD